MHAEHDGDSGIAEGSGTRTEGRSLHAEDSTLVSPNANGAPVEVTCTETETQPTWPTAPSYDFTSPHRVACVAASALDPEVDGCFFRSARWAADTVSVLTTAEDRVVRVLQTEFTDGKASGFSTARAFPQADAVNGALWYPSASVAAPESYCFVVSVRDTPVKLLDATDGRIRASYPIVDHQERFVAPHSMAFNTLGTKLYCGFESAIEVFDIATPGYNTAERRKTAATRRERGAQRGLISALAFSPHDTASFAAGAYTGSVALYDEDTSGAVGVLDGVRGGGVTQLAYHPLNAHVLFVASRRADAIQVYDLRDASAPLTNLERRGSTNQRIAFDVDPWGRWIASGDEHGTVRIWDAASFEMVAETPLAQDAVSAVQFHAYHPLLLTSAGSRATDIQVSSDEDSDSDSGSDSETTYHHRIIRPALPKDTRLSLWSMSPL